MTENHLRFYLPPYVFDTSGMVCGTPSTKLSVRPSVSPSVCPVSLLQQPVAGLLLWAWQQAISIDCCTARLQQAIHIHSSTALSSKCQQCHVYSYVGS